MKVRFEMSSIHANVKFGYFGGRNACNSRMQWPFFTNNEIMREYFVITQERQQPSIHERIAEKTVNVHDCGSLNL
jgi:hypothetical protein